MFFGDHQWSSQRWWVHLWCRVVECWNSLEILRVVFVGPAKSWLSLSLSSSHSKKWVRNNFLLLCNVRLIWDSSSHTINFSCDSLPICVKIAKNVFSISGGYVCYIMQNFLHNKDALKDTIFFPMFMSYVTPSNEMREGITRKRVITWLLHHKQALILVMPLSLGTTQHIISSTVCHWCLTVCNITPFDRNKFMFLEVGECLWTSPLLLLHHLSLIA